MFRWLDTHFDQMALTIVVWLCSLPLIVLIVLPLFGLEAAAVAALALLIIALVMCWSICAWKVFKG
ncbi:MAG TPA: hypothetical protein VJ793_23675 [Anaerolineae bacterium]|nr:hypothetical protein [Anaerolineae bacterium]